MRGGAIGMRRTSGCYSADPPTAVGLADIGPDPDAGTSATDASAARKSLEGTALDQDAVPAPTPVVIEDAPALAPVHEGEPVQMAPAVDIETLAARRIKRLRARRRYHWPFSALNPAERGP